MKIKRLIDLSQSFAEGGYNNPAFDDGKIDVIMRHKTEGWHAEVITTSTHTGTHLDAALHKIKGGISIDKYALERFIGDAVAIDLFGKTADEEITYEDVFAYDEYINPGMNVLLCTGWAEKKKPETKDEYLFHSPWLGAKAAQYLVDKGVNAVGIDHFSIGGANPDNVEIPHDILLGAQTLIIEGLILPKTLLERKVWQLIALPIKMDGTSGALTRAVAVEWE